MKLGEKYGLNKYEYIQNGCPEDTSNILAVIATLINPDQTELYVSEEAINDSKRIQKLSKNIVLNVGNMLTNLLHNGVLPHVSTKKFSLNNYSFKSDSRNTREPINPASKRTYDRAQDSSHNKSL